jgi:hypothetical protein
MAVGSKTMALRSLVCGVLAKKPEFARSEEGGEVCRLTLIGKAAGPASKPPRVSLYIRNGEGAPEGLRPDEARRCGFRLRAGDVIEAAGVIGPERERARRQEIVVDRRVRLRARAAEAAGAA